MGGILHGLQVAPQCHGTVLVAPGCMPCSWPGAGVCCASERHRAWTLWRPRAGLTRCPARPRRVALPAVHGHAPAGAAGAAAHAVLLTAALCLRLPGALAGFGHCIQGLLPKLVWCVTRARWGWAGCPLESWLPGEPVGFPVAQPITCLTRRGGVEVARACVCLAPAPAGSGKSNPTPRAHVGCGAGMPGVLPASASQGAKLPQLCA